MTRLRKGFKVLQLVISIALLGYLLRKYHYSLHSLEFRHESAYWFIPCVLIAVALIPLLAGLRWRMMLQSLGKTYPVKSLIHINFVSIFWGVFLPSADGFAIIRAILLMRKIDRKIAVSSVLLEKFIGIFCLFTIALAASYSFEATPSIKTLRLILVGVIILLAGVTLVVRKIPPKEGNRASIIAKLLQKMREVAVILANSRKNPLMLGILLVLAVQMMSILNIHFLFRVLGYQIPLLNHICFVPVIQTISLIPLTISGFGIREGAFVYFYQHLGVHADDAITVSILHFIIITGIQALIGGILSIYSHIGRADVSLENENSPRLPEGVVS